MTTTCSYPKNYNPFSFVIMKAPPPQKEITKASVYLQNKFYQVSKHIDNIFVLPYNGNILVEDCVAMDRNENKKMNNLEKLKLISTLKKNWNGNNANPFQPCLVDQMRKIILSLNIQPEIFPTACNTIQFEYENGTGEHLEFELSDNSLQVFYIDKNGKEIEYCIDIDIKRINEVVERFYGG